MRGWRPNRSDLLLLLATGSGVIWTVGILTGSKPDGALLGFAGTTLAVWATTLDQAQRKRGRGRRRDRDDNGRGREDDDG